MRFDLVKLDKARQLLIECKTIEDTKTVMDMAEAVRHYVKVKGLGLEASNHATEIYFSKQSQRFRFSGLEY